MPTKSALIRDILAFAREHNVVINPRVGYSYFVDGFRDNGHCPCRPDRLDCPCRESPEEILRNGHCACGLFYRDLATFLKKDSAVRILRKED